MGVEGLLLRSLEKLLNADLKLFQWHLVNDHERISKSEMEDADRLTTVDKLMACFRPEEAVKITVGILRKMNQNHLAERLENKHKQAQMSSGGHTGVSDDLAQMGVAVNAPVLAGNTITGPVTINYSTAGHGTDIIRWNRSSVKYRSKLEELQEDSSRKKVGNIYFSKYKIGSGGSGTVYLGLKEDGTEVAIKQIIKDQQESKYFENELKHLQDLNLESKNIVRYVDFAEDEDFYYLALQLCEYDLEDYMEIIRQEEQKDKDTALRKVVEEILHGLQVLHRAGVIHRDIKPGNILIDSGKNARLADFGLSRTLEDGRSTLHTARAGTRGWEATEILNQHRGYKKSSDIQVAGMLVYYILSGGKHPFGDVKDREENIKTGQYFLEDLQYIVAKDLVDRMIKKELAERLTIDEVLDHPYFWDDDRQDTVLRKLGDRPEIQKYETLAKFHDLYIKDKEHTEGREPTATLTIDEAFDVLKIENEKKRNDIIATVGEDLNDLWKLFNTAEEVTKENVFLIGNQSFQIYGQMLTKRFWGMFLACCVFCATN
ncbi:serine/threonine-protein kinase/endoribonuclease ire-1-like [Onychostoma macrolepis]|uniref:serine/threonine-protein kinase/endoribonuclease ire-1-like n=1 Tax=Onychostoma macrolepis TaxID=369639 RepID=UPI00272CCA77|nr:serine/threonine-protein kinase/endoribonuclease ire-1-like [Onychostoma macrolepis]